MQSGFLKTTLPNCWKTFQTTLVLPKISANGFGSLPNMILRNLGTQINGYGGGKNLLSKKVLLFCLNSKMFFSRLINANLIKWAIKPK